MLQIFTQLADWITYTTLGLSASSKLGDAIHFFIEDTSKIFVLLIVMIYFIAILRASMNMDVVKNTLQGRSRWFGYTAGSIFGAVTPFCSCSSIPLFLGFTAAGIPTGVTLSFLITSPLLNEIAIVLLGSLLGWEFTAFYIAIGLTAGIFGGLFFDFIGADKHLQPMAEKIREGVDHDGALQPVQSAVHRKMNMKERHEFAKNEAFEIFGNIWKWVLVGVGVGAGLHGFVPDVWIQEHLGNGAWWSVPVAVIMGIPLYSNATGMIPVVESLLSKGLPVGTALALMLSTVGASFPEFVMLKQVFKPRMLVCLFAYFLVAFTTTGWLLNLMY